MAYDAFRQVIGRAILDQGFRQQLFSNLGQMVSGYNLTPQEIDALRQITPQQLDGLSQFIRNNLGGAEKAVVDYFAKMPGADKAIVDYFLKIDGIDKATVDYFFKEMGQKAAVDYFLKLPPGPPNNLDPLIKGEIKMLDSFFAKVFHFGGLLDDGAGKLLPAVERAEAGPGGGPHTREFTGGVRGVLIGLLIIGILIGLLLFLPAEGMFPMMGMGEMRATSGELPPCPPNISDKAPTNQKVMMFLNSVRMPLGQGLCTPTENGNGCECGDNSTLYCTRDGGHSVESYDAWVSCRNAPEQDCRCRETTLVCDNGSSAANFQGCTPLSTGGGQPGGGQPTGGGEGSCKCQGTDYICTKPDGTVASASYNSQQCGGSGQCECRGTTYTCPDGTYAEFNPKCGVGGSACTCVPNSQCNQYPPNQCPNPAYICKENGKACNP